MSESRRSRKVLIADDDAAWREHLSGYLQQQGFVVVEASNGLESLVQVKRERPDAVVLDVEMPRLGGLDALKRIRPFDSAINVIFVMGSDDPQLKEQALGLGATAVLQKPLDLSILLAALQLHKR